MYGMEAFQKLVIIIAISLWDSKSAKSPSAADVPITLSVRRNRQVEFQYAYPPGYSRCQGSKAGPPRKFPPKRPRPRLLPRRLTRRKRKPRKRNPRPLPPRRLLPKSRLPRRKPPNPRLNNCPYGRDCLRASIKRFNKPPRLMRGGFLRAAASSASGHIRATGRNCPENVLTLHPSRPYIEGNIIPFFRHAPRYDRQTQGTPQLHHHCL